MVSKAELYFWVVFLRPCFAFDFVMWCVWTSNWRICYNYISILFIHFFELEQHGMYDIEKKIDDGLFLFFSSIKKLLTCVPSPSTLIAWLIDFTLVEKTKYLLEEKKNGNIGYNTDMVLLLLLLLLGSCRLHVEGRHANIHQPSPHTKIAGGSNNTKGLLS